MNRIMLICLLLCSVVRTFAQNTGFVVKPYLQYGTRSEMRVLWETDVPASTSVFYGIPGWHTSTPHLDKMMTVPGYRTMHEVHLTGLEAETIYLYQVISVTAGGDTLRGEVKTFKTAVNEDQAFAFVVFSDSQSNPDVWGRISDLGWKERPDFGLHAGDLVGLGYRKNDWVNEFFAPSQSFMSRIPLFSVPGNHEHDAAFYYQYMSNPEPEYRYTFDYGNARYYMVDSNRPLFKGTDQYTWLEAQLARSDKLWNFVVHHHPPYSSEEDDFGNTHVEQSMMGDPDLKDAIHLYEKYNVDVVFYGHIHTYERTWPLFRGRVNQEKGVIYINTGGAGGRLETAAPTRAWFTQKVRTTHHFCYVNIHDNRLDFQAIDENGQLFDQFSLSKDWLVKSVNSPEPPAPLILNKERVFNSKAEIKLKPVFENLEIRYTLDGSEPSEKSALYRGSLSIDKSLTLKAASFSGKDRSPVITADFLKENPYEPVKEEYSGRGINYTCYTSQEVRRLPFDQYERNEIKTGTALMISPEQVPHREQFYGITFEGFIEVKEAGLYRFSGHADDKLRVFVHDKLLIDEDREEINMEGQILLKAGLHPLRVEYFNETYESFLELTIEGPGLPRQSISPFMLRRK